MSTTNLEALGIDPLLTIDDVAAWLGKSRASLYKWAQRGYGPRPIKIGSELRYRRSTVDTWLDAQTENDEAA
ncbi:helix-turn-helix transcriptional regulator [Nocardioides sp. HB32]